MAKATQKVQVNQAYTHLRTYDSRYRFELLVGGSGSGKSYAVAQHIVLGALDPTNVGRKYLCVRKVARTLRNSVFALLRSIIIDAGLGSYYSFNKTEMSLTSVIGIEIILAGLDDVEKLKSVHGVTDVWVEESTELAPSDLKQLNLRMRGRGHQKRIVMTFNPILNTHWIKREFFDQERKNARIVKTTYRDNAFLDAEYARELESLRERDPYFYQVYALGEWGQLSNAVFTDFIAEDFDYGPDDLEHFGAGIDFGFNHPSAVVWAGMRDDEIYVYQEIYQSKLTNAELIAMVEEIDPTHQYSYIADSAEPDRIQEFRNAGFNIQPAKKGAGSVRHGVDWMKRHRIHIHAGRCPNLANEIQSYHYKEDREGNVQDDPVDMNNHGVDAARYLFESLWTGSHIQDMDWIMV